MAGTTVQCFVPQPDNTVPWNGDQPEKIEPGLCAKVQRIVLDIFQLIGHLIMLPFALMKYKDHLQAFFAWTLVRGHLEWDRGNFPLLGMVDIVKDRDRNITGYHLTPAAEFLQQAYQDRRAAIPAAGIAV